MRYAILSDIHGNRDALEAVLEDIEQQVVDACVCLGDIVGYGPEPAECLRTIQKYAGVTIAGNHDFAAANRLNISTFNVLARAATLWTREALDDEDIEYLANLPLVASFGDFEVVHGTTHSPELFDYVQTSYDAHLAMSHMKCPVCFIGHSHIPVNFVQAEIISYSFDTELRVPEGGRVIVNVGSVGQPRDRDPRSAYAVYDTEEKVVRLRRVAYDVEAVAEKIRKAGLPEQLGERLKLGR